MARVAIVTDSTAYIPQDWVKKYDLSVVPLFVLWSGEELKDGVDIYPTEFYQRLESAKEMPTTSQPTPAEFHKVYQTLAEKGHDILSIHISSKLSGTVDSAIQAKAMLPEANIEVFDSLSASMETGWHVLAAAKAAMRGASLAECKAMAEKAQANSGILFMVDTLEFLHRGGRIGGAQRFLGTALNFKPILEIQDGAIEALERVRTKRKALDRLMELIEERIDGRKPVYLSSIHANAAETAEEVLEQLAARVKPVETAITEVSPAIGTHTGPGAIVLSYLAGVTLD
jgi:DegV family protein with EDD domain